ncbi:hypothetical protein [Mesorhizobium erdmanii]|uniref:Uncharacterized protein n=1 Tax=Mesorhizobium erdmanii TaxID=1777866 RepID=A0A6M7UJP8_9HYPH|nr:MULTISPECIES: hypothetical protein [Mesorhizobium]OBQ70351.1 hypothetical protein A8146_27465 [Mesorhizobium loti]QKC76360.1 hypothetical protein EB233_13145 [Mesorhizobium erdmanii]
MASRQIQSITERLPYSLKEGVKGYVDAVAAVVPDIARDARVEISGDRLDQFLLIVAIRRIWSTVNSQFWIMNDCISVATRTPLGPEDSPQTRGFRIGRDEISQDSSAFVEGRDLRQELYKLIVKLDIEHLVAESSSLSDVAVKMFVGEG